MVVCRTIYSVLFGMNNGSIFLFILVTIVVIELIGELEYQKMESLSIVLAL